MPIDPFHIPAPRKAGLRGKRSPAHLPIRPVHEYLTAPLPLSPDAADVTGGINDWLMLGNGPDPTLTVNGGTPVGDCVPAATYHNMMAKARVAGAFEPGFIPPTADAVVSKYERFTGGADNGVVIGEWLSWCFQQGLIEAFAPVDYTNAEAMHSAMIAFHGVIAGVQLDADAETQFENHQPWVFDGSATVGGHGILLVEYSPGEDVFISWGAAQPAQIQWGTSTIDEAWVIVTAEDAKNAGVNYQALLADIRATNGGQAPPAPTPVPAAAAFEKPATIQEVVKQAREQLADLDVFLERLEELVNEEPEESEESADPTE